jgi:hypothetical protein
MSVHVGNATIDAANDIIRRLQILDDGLANGRAYRQLLETLHAREGLRGDAAEAAGMVRAGVLRAALGCAMAALDPPDPRDNRASIGQILKALRDQSVAAELTRPVSQAAAHTGTLASLQADYDNVRAEAAYARCRDLRNGSVAHFLLAPSAPVEYSDVYAMQDAAEHLAINLFAFCGGRRPRFPEHAARTGERASLFWELYFQGAAARD